MLTDAGRTALSEARETHIAGVRALFLERFDEDELESLGDLWQRVLPVEAIAAGRRV